jgi:alanyl-tRNA synthetase
MATSNTSSESVRQTFIDFFVQKKEHTFVPSSSVIPHDDDTLLFANAGMNQFKPIFLGSADPTSDLAKLKRAVNSQKCIRAGGKHNDLEDVGKDTYHHTFFEMLGNWSFGNYFKEEAISWAWELLTSVYKLNPERLYVTYFEGYKPSGLEPDLEARDIWLRFLPSERVLPYGMKENFWEMGETGPCGPCSEIHYDRIGGRDASKLVNADDPLVIEIWNNVFIQFNREADGSLRSLPAKHVDTGMGLERLCSIIQGVKSNYDTDLFVPLFEAIQKATGYKEGYKGKLGKEDPENVDMAYRVIADHIRTLTFAINDGAVPGNDKRGYVLRRILRRAVRYGKQILGAPNGFFHTLVPVVVEKMSGAFPELKKNPTHVMNVLRDEEDLFNKTLDKGLRKFDKIVAKLKKEGKTQVAGEDAYQLYTTSGFPIDLTRLMADEQGFTVDEAEFNAKLEKTKDEDRSRVKKETKATINLNAEGASLLKKAGVNFTDDAQKYVQADIEAVVKALWTGSALVDSFTGKGDVAVVVDRTNFYAEQGGQIFDTGVVEVKGGAAFKVEDVKTFGGFVTHNIKGKSEGTIKVGDKVTLKVDYVRRAPVKSNHTSTHMLNFALREVLGNGVEQEGSLVDPERLRFDFSYGKPLTTAQVTKIDQIVVDTIKKDLPVYTKEVRTEEAKKIFSLRAVFGEVYPDPVRVVSIGRPVEELLQDPSNQQWAQYSIEFCGGTHLSNSKEAVAFTVVSEEATGSGVRRVIAVTGKEAIAAAERGQALETQLTDLSKLEGAELEAAVNKFQGTLEHTIVPLTTRDRLNAKIGEARERIKEWGKSKKASQEKNARGHIDVVIAELEQSNAKAYVGKLEVGSNPVALTEAIKGIREKKPEVAVLLISPDPPKKKICVVAHTPAGSSLKANEWVQSVSAVLGGKGGGKPDVAQGQGTDFDKVDAAIKNGTEFAVSKLV